MKNAIIGILLVALIVIHAQQENESVKDAFSRVSNNIYVTALEIVHGDKNEN